MRIEDPNSIWEHTLLVHQSVYAPRLIEPEGEVVVVFWEADATAGGADDFLAGVTLVVGDTAFAAGFAAGLVAPLTFAGPALTAGLAALVEEVDAGAAAFFAGSGFFSVDLVLGAACFLKRC